MEACILLRICSKTLFGGQHKDYLYGSNYVFALFLVRTHSVTSDLSIIINYWSLVTNWALVSGNWSCNDNCTLVIVNWLKSIFVCTVQEMYGCPDS